MKGWSWLTGHNYNKSFPIRVLLKALILFVSVNLVFAVTNPLPLIGHVTIYNWLVPGRERLPYGESSAAYNLSLNSLEAMFSSHTVSQPKQDNEYRILLMGDSSVWGVLLDNNDTLAGRLNAAGLQVDDKHITFYNLGHPIMSATKDLMLMDYALRYQPDLIIWLVTLESLPYPKQVDAPIVQNNALRVRALIEHYNLAIPHSDTRFVEANFWERTLIGQRRALADWWRLQLYGVNWAITNIDQLYKDYEPRSNDFDADTTWQEFAEESGFQASDIAIDVLDAGHQLTGDVPLIIVNEPIYIADGLNSDVRYNFWYPKWAYDRYRKIMAATAEANGWNYVDLWDSIARNEFTDSPVHLTAKGSAQLSAQVGNALSSLLKQQ